MYKTTDTIIVDAVGRDETIEKEFITKIADGYQIVSVTKDSLFYENYCGTKEIKILNSLNNEKKYCYPN